MSDGIPIDEFCAYVDLITKRFGEGVMVAASDNQNQMHFSKDGKHLGYIDLATRSLVYDKPEE